MMNTKEMIEVMEAWLAGAVLEVRTERAGEEWREFSNELEPTWDWDTYEWRVKPEVKTNWQPTNELRIALRHSINQEHGDVYQEVLQQKWERYESEWYEGKLETKWRDVPVEEE